MALATALPASKRFASEASRWNAVKRRKRGADGVFYYSVRTTGVYCRPSCAARLPKRENVFFHSSREEAERAGFRPCKRCRPNEASLDQRHRDAVARACRLIEDADEAPSLSELAHAAGMSAYHFHRVFRMTTGVTPKAYATAHRARRVRDELADGSTVTDAIYGAGFNSNGRFYATANEQLGMTPTAFRAGGDGATIRFAVGECSLGSVLVAASEKGICAIFLGDDPDNLAHELQDRFPRAEIVGADAAFDRWVSRVVGLVEQPARGLDLPLDVRGTAFQVRVWNALRQIPPGSTASYTEIARRIGMPTGARAVASACAANHIAIAIPCHRVVRTDESLSGYRWSVERKAELLKRERGQ
jgi:AraC family transcriptional regulator, regulatory protein of adaptative response / methylated-DNA-[protein]-cysteine methyltransferase